MDHTYSHLRDSKPVRRRPQNGPVFGIGFRAFVHWPQPSGTVPKSVPMLDGTGRSLPNDLVDGQEVEILSWRPRAREGVSYQVRRTADGSEWWIAVQYLRRDRDAAASAKQE